MKYHRKAAGRVTTLRVLVDSVKQNIETAPGIELLLLTGMLRCGIFFCMAAKRRMGMITASDIESLYEDFLRDSEETAFGSSEEATADEDE